MEMIFIGLIIMLNEGGMDIDEVFDVKVCVDKSFDSFDVKMVYIVLYVIVVISYFVDYFVVGFVKLVIVFKEIVMVEYMSYDQFLVCNVIVDY